MSQTPQEIVPSKADITPSQIEMDPEMYEKRFKFIFLLSLFCVECAIIGLYALISYNHNYGVPDLMAPIPKSKYLRPFPILTIMNYYWIHIDASIFMLLGYGFLVVFLKSNRWMSLSMTFLASALAIQLTLLWTAFWLCVNFKSWPRHFAPIDYGISNSIFFNYFGIRGAIAILISLGALIGKVDPLQVVILTVLEVIIFTVNDMICNRMYYARDIGGCFYIHAFGSITGIVVSWIYSPKSSARNNPNMRYTYFSSTATFIGTFFLWISFPSFNSYNPTMNDNLPWNLCSISLFNTFYSLTASTISSMWISFILNGGKLDWESITFGSLSGGVIISASCDMFAYPWPPLLVGSLGGIISVLSLKLLVPNLEKLYLFDTRSTLALHFIPSLFGMVVSCSQCCFLDTQYFQTYQLSQDYTLIRNGLLNGYTGYKQGLWNFVAFLISIAFGIGIGGIIGLIFRIWRFYEILIL